MADEEGVNQDGDAESEKQPCARIRMELRDTLPGDRAVIGIEQDGELVWLGSKKHVDEQAWDEFEELLSRIVEEGWWTQNWPGR